MIDDVRRDLLRHQAQLRDELQRVTAALAALGVDATSATGGAQPISSNGISRRQARRPPAMSRAAASGAAGRRRRGAAATSGARSARGETTAAVLGRLSATEARTAGDVAAATGVARGTASTTLHALTQKGKARKAPRGYLLAPPAPTDAT